MHDNTDGIKAMLHESAELKKRVADKLAKNIEEAIKLIIGCYNNNGRVLICGNGGSAADAQHFAAELVVRFKLERKPLACIALTTNSSVVTACANDYGFDAVFERQVEALGNEDDVLIAISTSGNSANIIKALEKAKEMSMKTISLLGKDGGKTKGIADMDIIVQSNNTPRIQEAHITILHIICELVEKGLFGK